MSAAEASVHSSDNVRNVVLVGNTGVGKTTFAEAALLATGGITRAGRVEDGSTVSDYDPVEVRQQRSVNLSLIPVTAGSVKINLLDTPGYADFIGDLRAGLRGADAALFVISAAEGINGATRLLWQECAAVGMPRAVVVTKLDHQRADFEETVAQCRELLSEGVHPLYLPLLADDGQSVTGLIGLLSQHVYDYSSGTRVERDADPEHIASIRDARNALIEAIVTESEDESLLEQYLGGAEISLDTLITDLERAVARGAFYPLLALNPVTGLGVAEALEVVTQGFPSPPEHQLPPVTAPDGTAREPMSCDPDGPLLAEVIKTSSEPYVGKLSLVRVFSGTLRPDTFVHVSGHFLTDRGHDDHDVDERVGALSAPVGKVQRPLSAAVAGDICAVAKLARAETGDTLSDVANPRLMEPWLMPDPMLPVAVVAHTKSDEDKLSQALGRLVTEDPTMRLGAHEDTGQLVLWCMGEAHADVLLDRLRTKYGVAVDMVALKLSLRETFAAKSAGHGRHVKQSGGHGQYGVCEIEVEPLPAGTGFEFVDKVVGGAIPRQYIVSVEKGIRAQMQRGVADGYPLVDIRVTLLGGKAHSVDSSDMAFQSAGALALRDAAAATDIVFLEPVAQLSVLVSDEYVGQVMNDLSTRRARVTGTEPAGGGRTVIRAEVPELELTRYVVDLRSISQGTGTFSRASAGYQPMPPAVALRARQATEL